MPAMLPWPKMPKQPAKNRLLARRRARSCCAARKRTSAWATVSRHARTSSIRSSSSRRELVGQRMASSTPSVAARRRRVEARVVAGSGADGGAGGGPTSQEVAVEPERRRPARGERARSAGSPPQQWNIPVWPPSTHPRDELAGVGRERRRGEHVDAVALPDREALAGAAARHERGDEVAEARRPARAAPSAGAVHALDGGDPRDDAAPGALGTTSSRRRLEDAVQVHRVRRRRPRCAGPCVPSNTQSVETRTTVRPAALAASVTLRVAPT